MYRFICFGVTPHCVQSLLLALCSGITLEFLVVLGAVDYSGIELGLIMCNTTVSPSVLSLWPLFIRSYLYILLLFEVSFPVFVYFAKTKNIYVYIFSVFDYVRLISMTRNTSKIA